MEVEIEAKSLLGSREEQQDCYSYRKDGERAMAVLCDGMGGLNGGAVASREAVSCFEADYRDWLKTAEEAAAFLGREAVRLDKKVYGLSDGRGRTLGAGSTIVAVVAEKNQIHWLAVGDSLIFVIRGKEIVQVNQKHNYQLMLEEMKAYGKISEQVFEQEKDKGKRLISYLGMGNATIFDINQTPFLLKENDVVVLCSDGVSDVIETARLHALVKGAASVREAAEAIEREIQKAARRNQDNATYIIMKWKKNGGMEV